MVSPAFGLLLADLCMLGVILCVQLVIYPSFAHISRKRLVQWHALYTRRISFLVVPLMLLQLIGGGYWFYSRPGLASVVYLSLVLILWGLTFRIFVPLHKRIGAGIADERTFSRLVGKNWYRTWLWAGVFIWHLAACAGWIP